MAFELITRTLIKNANFELTLNTAVCVILSGQNWSGGPVFAAKIGPPG